MSRIISFSLYRPQKNESHLKISWDSLKSLDNFTKMTVAILLIWLFSTPFIVSNSLILGTHAQTLDSMDTIYYNSSQEKDSMLSTASSDLKKALEKVSKKTFAISTTDVPTTGFFLEVDPNNPNIKDKNNEAFQLLTDAKGIHIIGKTALAVQDGVYELLEKLGFRRYFKHPIWEIEPASLVFLDLNEVHEPSYIFRTHDFPQVYRQSHSTAWNEWFRWNRMGGAVGLSAIHSYRYIAIDAFNTLNPGSGSLDNDAKILKLYEQYPQGFCKKPTTTDNWQLNVDDPKVLQWAISYARKAFQSGTLNAIISPNDGGGFCWNETDYQQTTDKVLGFANNVARELKDEFPNGYISVYSYAGYSCLPSFSLEPHLFVSVATGYNYCGLDYSIRLSGLQAKGAITGVRDYFFLPQTLSDLSRIPWYSDRGVNAITAETKDYWGTSGLFYFIASHLYWNPNLDVNAMKEEFYIKSFGITKEPMKRYFERWFRGETVDERTLALAARDLKEAYDIAILSGNIDVLDRVRYMQMHLHYLWNDVRLPNMNLREVTDYLTFICKASDTFVFDSRAEEHRIERDYLRNKFGWTIDQYTAFWQSVSPSGCGRYGNASIPYPTDSEIKTWFDADYTYFSGSSAEELPLVPDPFTSSFEILDSNVVSESVFQTDSPSFVLTSTGGEMVTIQARGTYGIGKFVLTYSDGITTKTYPGIPASSSKVTPITITLPKTGTYRLDVAETRVMIDIPGRGAGILVGQGDRFSWSSSLVNGQTSDHASIARWFFYVPPNTVSFIAGASAETGRPLTIKFTNPSGKVIQFVHNESGYKEWIFNGSEKGLWKVEATKVGGGTFYLKGVPPIIWHDPKYLLVPSLTNAPVSLGGPNLSSQSFNFQSILTPLYIFTSKPANITFKGSGFDSGDTFIISFKDSTGKIKRQIIARPLNTSTLELKLDLSVVSGIPRGEYDIEMEKLSDSIKRTFSKKLIFTKLGDVWSGTATEISEQKRDGRINMYDVIRFRALLGKTDATSLTDGDINRGPNSISQGKVDIYDVNLLMQNWGAD